jgi:hypothetical protein
MTRAPDGVNGHDGAVLSLATKINRLFEVFRSRDEFEQSEEAVARSVSRFAGHAVSAGEIHALRTGDELACDPEVIAGLVAHFGIPAAYLTSAGPQAENLDQQLQLLAAARDAGVKRLALRGEAPGLDSAIAVVKEIGD